MAESWLPAVEWAGDYPSTGAVQTVQQAGRTVRKKRSAKQHRVEELAEHTITFEDVDMESIYEKSASISKAVKDVPSAARTHEAGPHADGKLHAASKTRKKRKSVADPAAKETEQATESSPRPGVDGASDKLHGEASTQQSDKVEPIDKVKKSTSGQAQVQDGVREAEEMPVKKKKRKNKFKLAEVAGVVQSKTASGDKQVPHADAAEEERPRKKKKSVQAAVAVNAVGSRPEEVDAEEDIAATASGHGAVSRQSHGGDESTAAELSVPRESNACNAKHSSMRGARLSKATAKPQTTPARPEHVNGGAQPEGGTATRERVGGPLGATPGSQAKGVSKLGQMRLQLQGGRFRMLNEKLYTTDGDHALAMMQETPALFEAYHDGFRAQTKSWESNPVDVALKWLRSKPAGWVVADFGCGEAQLAQDLGAHNKVHSFDLVAANEHVTACNMASVPLQSASCDAAVFSLALMGTDYSSFLAEARRVLKPKGFLWIAEVRSRFVPDGADTEDFKAFIAALKQLGFVLLKQDTSNRMFVVWVLSKMSDVQDTAPKIQWPVLKACIYKRR